MDQNNKLIFLRHYRTQVNKKKVKIFSVDNGLASVNSLSVSKDDGRKLENLVYLHLRRSHTELYYYNEK